jgi:hypothetical protein
MGIMMEAQAVASPAENVPTAPARERGASHASPTVELGHEGLAALAELRRAQMALTPMQVREEQQISARLAAGLTRLIKGISAFRRSQPR